MIVYGDHSRRLAPGAVLADWTDRRPVGPGVETHARLVDALIAAGQIAQGLADDDFVRAGRDRDASAARIAMRAAVALARLVGRSWDGGFEAAALPDPARVADLLATGALDRELDVREPEGFAHYAVYPEGYYRAAAGWTAGRGARVIGLRSIGTTLAAAVAAATGAEVPLTLRPVGPPFARGLSLDPGLDARLADPLAPAFAVVDEGPGLSGSSFGTVADALEERGVGPARVAFFPSHGGEPGAMASPRHRARWASATRLVTGFDDLVLAAERPAHRLEHWVADLTGRATGPLVDLAGGRWRNADGTPRSDEPPSDPPAERRKFLLRAERGSFLLKFVGLGRSGTERARLQGRLAAAGFVPPVSGMRHGFTVEPWRSDLRPLATAGPGRRAVADHLGRYLAVRAGLPADGRSGASVEALAAMLSVNAREALGEEAGREVAARWRPHVATLAEAVRPVLVDARLQAWEWLVAPDGRLLKTDAVDHHAGHDLIGCQDIAWDLAGAAVEFDLDPDARGRLARAVADATGRAPPPLLLGFCRDAYLAFQIGACDLAAGRAGDVADRDRWLARGAGLRDRLRAGLGGAGRDPG